MNVRKEQQLKSVGDRRSVARDGKRREVFWLYFPFLYSLAFLQDREMDCLCEESLARLLSVRGSEGRRVDRR